MIRTGWSGGRALTRDWALDLKAFLQEHAPSRRGRSNIRAMAQVLEGHPNARAMYNELRRFATGKAQAEYLQQQTSVSRAYALRLAAALYIAVKSPKLHRDRSREHWRTRSLGL